MTQFCLFVGLHQVGLVLLALSFYVRPYLQQHNLVTGQKINSDLFPYGLIAASAATLISRSANQNRYSYGLNM